MIGFADIFRFGHSNIQRKRNFSIDKQEDVSSRFTHLLISQIVHIKTFLKVLYNPPENSVMKFMFGQINDSGLHIWKWKMITYLEGTKRKNWEEIG